MDVFDWIEETLHPRTCNSEAFIYDDMESQSGRSLPVIYQPFDAGQKAHWRDRGSLFDYLFSTRGQGKRLLDFGPGDGWPSLIVAPYAAEVVGVEGARRRAAVCAENAARLGIANARFIYVAPGTPLPFADGSFDGVMASSSIEQTPDPRATLRELGRVLRPGGRLRVDYESLGAYRGGRERDVWLVSIGEERCALVLFDRDVDGERVRQYRLTCAMPAPTLARAFSEDPHALTFGAITVPRLEEIRAAVLDARVCTTMHPSGATFASWLRDAGFGEIVPSHSGARFAGEWFEQLPGERRPADMDGVDALVGPAIQVVVHMLAPLDTDPMLTAIK